MRQAINHAARVWKVDVISMSFSFREQVFSIKEAIEYCASQSRIIFLAAASRNEGRNSPITFPAAYNHLVIPIISTNSLGQLSGFNPPPHRGCERFATLGENVLSAWPSSLSNETGKLVRSGTSTATSIAAGLVACILEFVRAGVETVGRTGKPSDRVWANIHTLEGMKAILRLIAPDESIPYLAPSLLTDLGRDHQAIMDAIYNRALKKV